MKKLTTASPGECFTKVDRWSRATVPARESQVRNPMNPTTCSAIGAYVYSGLCSEPSAASQNTPSAT